MQRMIELMVSRESRAPSRDKENEKGKEECEPNEGTVGGNRKHNILTWNLRCETILDNDNFLVTMSLTIHSGETVIGYCL